MTKNYLPQHTSTDKVDTHDGLTEVARWKIENGVSWRQLANKKENRT